MTERNTVDWGSLEDSADVQIAKILADEIVADYAEFIGHPVAVDATEPVRVIEEAK